MVFIWKFQLHVSLVVKKKEKEVIILNLNVKVLNELHSSQLLRSIFLQTKKKLLKREVKYLYILFNNFLIFEYSLK